MTDRLTSITLASVKDHLRIDHDAEDTLLQGYIDASLSEIERYIGADLDADAIHADLAFAVQEMVAFAYDNRANPDAKPGLTPAAARICARHRGVSL